METVGFFKKSHGFKSPIRVLLDGKFTIKTWFLTHAKSQILALFPEDTVEYYTTRCIVFNRSKASRNLDKALSANIRFAKCSHKKALGGLECIESLFANNNKDKFVLATTDTDLCARFHQKPCVPIILAAPGRRLILKKPSRAQKAYADVEKEDRARVLQEGVGNILREAAAELGVQVSEDRTVEMLSQDIWLQKSRRNREKKQVTKDERSSESNSEEMLRRIKNRKRKTRRALKRCLDMLGRINFKLELSARDRKLSHRNKKSLDVVGRGNSEADVKAETHGWEAEALEKRSLRSRKRSHEE